MNNSQKILLVTISILVIFMLLFPPFFFNSATDRNKGYHFILNPPGDEVKATVNHNLLITQFLGLSIAGFCLFLVFRRMK